ncbi:uncharacterized protein ASCRUDRAFT_93014 [Ascoidea rubescens DSM 1968]|uniref:PPP4R2-domain-containing protein n=1 Tax=Ascoidea rubescens DSM 1968 TaxID=1344418 RepID=A0A1D2VAP1_9ASCO|nr:hypothetical protein ASCRUDRAFT_93014 [Ascoidea rubescens DSM 1968]ODV58503.1 hypothetical protein ASCRUDRAFT_93014 [Ascoidea rubescens DSM 1968]
MIDKDLETALLQIKAQKHYNSEKNLPWNILLLKIELELPALITQNFNRPLTTFIENPLLNELELIQQIINRVIAYLKDIFYYSPPFTIFRIAELLLEPNRYYSNRYPEKFLRGLESSIFVNSSIDDFPKIEFSKPNLLTRSNISDSNDARKPSEEITNFLPLDLKDVTNDELPNLVMTKIPWITDKHIKEINEEEEEEERLSSEDEILHVYDEHNNYLDDEKISSDPIMVKNPESIEDIPIDHEMIEIGFSLDDSFGLSDLTGLKTKTNNSIASEDTLREIQTTSKIRNTNLDKNDDGLTNLKNSTNLADLTDSTGSTYTEEPKDNLKQKLEDQEMKEVTN